MTWESTLYALILLAIGVGIGFYAGIYSCWRLIDHCSRTGELLRYAGGRYKVWRVEDEPPAGAKWKL